MRSLFYGATALLVLSGPAMPQTMGPEAVARVVSLMAAIQTQCSKFGPIDRELVDRFALANAKMGQDMIGREKFNRLAEKEIKRRSKEVDATGAAMWCNYQRPNLNELGLKAFLD